MATPRKRAPAGKPRAVDALSPGGAVEGLGGEVNGGGLPTPSQLIVRAGIASWSLVGAMVLLAAVLWVLREVRVLFPPVILAVVIVLLLEPVVAWLVGKGIRRGAAVGIVYLLLVAAIAGASYVAIPSTVRQGRQFAKELPALLQEGGSLAASTLRRLNQDDLGKRIAESVTEFVNENAVSVTENVSRFWRFGLRLANLFVTVVVGLILGIYGLLGLPRMGAAFTRVVPAERRAQIGPVLTQIREVFTGFLRARLIVSAVVGGLAIFGLWAVGMPFWLILGLIVGVTNLIPMIGSFLGGLPVVLVAMLTKPPIFIVISIVVLVIAHAVEGYVLSPLVLRGRTNLHPIAVLLAVIVGGALLGLWGIVAAVPVAGAVQVVVLEVIRRRRQRIEAPASESPA